MFNVNRNYLHLKEFDPAEILEHPLTGTKCFHIDGKDYITTMSSLRYHTFKNSLCCVACGIVGTKMILDLPSKCKEPHFNLYAEENGLLLMTKDHIVPKCRGGTDDLSNLQTMCVMCNGIKNNREIDLRSIALVKQTVLANQELPRHKLKKLIRKQIVELTLS